LYFVHQVGVYDSTRTYRDKKVVEVSLCVFVRRFGRIVATFTKYYWNRDGIMSSAKLIWESDSVAASDECAKKWSRHVTRWAKFL
jgi:hypothetical protein